MTTTPTRTLTSATGRTRARTASLTAECRENADTPVVFNLTVMRNARQGFFDVAIDFEDVHCSAKLDCVDDLLHDPATGARGPTVVLGFACTSGQDADGTPQDTFLYLDDVRIECTNPIATYTFDPTEGPGQVGGQPPGIFQTAFYRGHEDLPGLDKCYWNAAFGLDLETLADPGVLEGDCWLRARGTASETALVDGATPDDTIYPVIEWNVQLTRADGTLVCGENPLGAEGSGVQTTYTDFVGAQFGCAMECSSAEISCGEQISCTGSVPSIPGQVTVGQSGDNLTLSFQGQDYAFPIDPAYTLAGCCADSCCSQGATP